MRKGKALKFERLENRRLLAADLGYDVMQTCEAIPTETCMVAPDIAETATQEVCVDPIAPDQGPIDESAAIEPAITLDLSDGMDGYFGSLDAENQSDSLSFAANADGMVDIVVASSFGDNSTNLQVNDSEGNLVTASETEGLEGFATLSFAAQGDQAYELTISSEDGGNGNFQVTIGLEANVDESVDDAPAAPEADAGGNADEGCLDEDLVEDVVEDETASDETDVEIGDEDTDQGPVPGTENEEICDPADATPETDVAVDEQEPDEGPVADVDVEENCVLDDSSPETDVVPDEGPVGEDSDSEVDSEQDAEVGDETEADEDIIDDVEPTNDTEEDLNDSPTDSGPEADTGTDDGETEVLDETTTDDEETVDCTDGTEASSDLHANEIGSDATEILIVDGSGSIQGDLETVDDVDVFRFTSPNSSEVTLFAGELSDENVDMDVKVFNSSGNLIVDGATNEAVKISFLVEQDAEYYISVSSDSDQAGSYDVLVEVAEPEIVDDHANEIGDDATLIETTDSIGNSSGELEVGTDTDAFRIVAGADGEIVLDLQVQSEEHQSDAQVSVYAEGQLIADGTTNESVGLRFDAAANTQYQVLVDSLNDTVMTYELTTNEFPTTADSSELIVDTAPTPDAEPDETLAAADIEVCTFDEDCTEEAAIDEVFSDFGGDELAAADLNEFSEKPDYTNFQWAFSFDGDRFDGRFTGS